VGEDPERYTSLSLDVEGDAPLRELNAQVSRLNYVSPDGKGWGGPTIYQRIFPTFFKTRGFDRDSIFGVFPQPGQTRIVLHAHFSALNGHWQQMVKLREVGGRWTYRSVVYIQHPKPGQPFAHTVLREKTSKLFPEAEKSRPLLPVTKEDIGQ
jgi:hypothetical protein